MPFGSLRWQRGDPDGVFACAAHLLSDTFTTSTVQAAAMEPYAVVVQPERATVTVHHGTPAPFHLREQIAAWLGFGLTDVRVVSPPVGGGFGSRMDDLPFVATALALRCRRPVRLVLPRSEGFVSGRVRHGARITVRSALDAEGNLVARELDAVYDVGGHLDLGPYVILRALRPLALYRCEHLRFVGRLVYTNRPVSSATRGFGNPQASFAVESHNDRLCSELGLDPAAFRRRHLLASGDVNVSVGRVDTAIGAFQPTGALIGSCEVRACLDRVLDALAHRPRPDRDRLLRGTGIACAMHTTGKGRKELSTAAVTRTADGVIVESGAPDQGGTGVATSLAMIAGEVLGVPLEAIEVRLGDTATELHDSGAHASGRTYVAGAAVHGAACRVRERLDAGAALPVRERVAHRPSTNAPPFACCGAAVAVDPDTGTVKVEGLVVAVDIGRVLNPMHARGQVTGAVVQGIGYALWERLDFGPDGRLLTAGMYDYGVPRPADVPPIEVHFVDGHEPSHPAGVKGVGEIGLMAVAPAIANAVFDATGARIRDLPITAEKVWSALRDSSRNHRPARTSGP